jgi:nucleoside 2-deoxyribosyltransferase
MNIYFACSITGGREFEPVYRQITEMLLSDGHTVPTAYLADPGVKLLEEKVIPREVYERDTTWIQECHALIAEVSTPSHGVGYEIAYALSLQKPVLCVYKEGRSISKMLTGNSHPSITIKSYHDPLQAIKIIHSFLLEHTS